MDSHSIWRKQGKGWHIVMQKAHDSHSSIDRLIDAHPVSALQYAVIGLCILLNVFDGYDVVAIAYTAPTIAEQWQVAPEALGVIFSASLAGMTAGAVLLAPFTDRIGRRQMIIWALALDTVGMLATVFAADAVQLGLARFVTGLGIGAMLASLTSLVTEYAPRRRRNLAIGLLQAGYPVGATGGGFLAAWLIPAYGWQSVFLLGGIASAAVLLIIALMLPESLDFLARKRPTGGLERANRILSRMGIPALAQWPELPPDLAASNPLALFASRFRSHTILLWTAFFFSFLTLYFLLSWLPKIVVDLGFLQSEGLRAGIVFNAGAILGVVALGWLADRSAIGRLIALFLVIGGAAMVAFGALSATMAMILALAFIVGAFVDGGFAGLYAVAARLYPAELRTTGIGWAIGLGRLGGIAGPYLGGLAVGAGLATTALFALFAAPLLIAALAVLAIGRDALET